jgi:hypothetical protein
MMSGYLIFLTFMSSAMLDAPQPTVRDLEFRPRVGLMSEEVARAKLKVYGITDIRTFKATESAFEVEAEQDGRRLVLRIDPTRGIMREQGATLPLGPANAALRYVPRADPGAVKVLNDRSEHERRPELDRTPLHQHIRHEGKPVP